MREDLAERLLESMISGRLAIISGAGLSVAPPSRIPLASALAEMCFERHRQKYGVSLPQSVKNDLEGMTTLFDGYNTLESIFLPHDVPWAVFRTEFNLGHEAIADFLWCAAVSLGVTTNYDCLVETAAHNLGGAADFWQSVSGFEAATERAHRPYLKIHGCVQRDPIATVWCVPQLDRPPVKERFESSKKWLEGVLLGKDILFVGFWSDWAYLTNLLHACIETVVPNRVFLIDPAPPDLLQQKAPRLWDWSHRQGVVFEHIQETGTGLLDELRGAFSRRFLKRVFDRAEPQYEAYSGGRFNFQEESARVLDTRTLYEIRRSLCGAMRNEAVQTKEPSDAMIPAAVAHMTLLAKGAKPAMDAYELAGKRIRVVRGAGLLSYVRAKYLSEPPPPEAYDIVICAGATDDGAAPNVVRGAPSPTIIRSGETGVWMTLESAYVECLA